MAHVSLGCEAWDFRTLRVAGRGVLGRRLARGWGCMHTGCTCMMTANHSTEMGLCVVQAHGTTSRDAMRMCAASGIQSLTADYRATSTCVQAEGCSQASSVDHSGRLKGALAAEQHTHTTAVRARLSKAVARPVLQVVHCYGTTQAFVAGSGWL